MNLSDKYEQRASSENILMPTLDIPKSSIYGNRFMNGLSDFLTTVSKGLGHTALGPVGEFTSEKIGEWSKDRGNEKSDIAAYIGEDLLNKQIEFHQTKNFEDRLNYLTKLGVNLSVVRANDLGVQYEINYLRESIVFIKELMGDLNAEDGRLGSELDTVGCALDDLNHRLSELEKEGNANAEMIANCCNSALEKITAVQVSLHDQLDKVLSKIESKADQKQIDSMNKLLEQFGMHVDEKRASENKQYRAMVSMVGNIEKRFQAQARQQKINEQFISAGHAFNAIAAIGQTFGNRDIARIGVIGKQSVAIAHNVGMLTGSFGLVQVSGLAMLGPMSAIVMAGLTIFNCFQKQSSGLKKIAKQIRSLHQEMRSSFNRVMKNQEVIYRTLIKGLDYLVTGIKVPLTSKLNSLEEELIRSESIASEERKSIHLYQLRELLAKADALLEFDMDGFDSALELKFLTYRSRLNEWLITESCSPLYTGRLHLKNIGRNSGFRSLARTISQQEPENIIGLLAEICNQYDAKFPKDIDVSKLFNSNIWANSLPSYLMLTQKLSEIKEMKNTNKCVYQSMIENMQRFLVYLQSAPSLFQALVNMYRFNFEKLNLLLDQKFRDLKKDNSELKIFTVAQLIATQDALDVEIEKLIDTLDFYFQVVQSLSKLSGIAQLSCSINLMNRDQILKTQLDWADLTTTQKQFSDRYGYGQVGIATAFVQCEYQINDKFRLLMASITPNKSLSLSYFDANANCWIALDGEVMLKKLNLKQSIDIQMESVVNDSDSRAYIFLKQNGFIQAYWIDPEEAVCNGRVTWHKLERIGYDFSRDASSVIRLSTIQVDNKNLLAAVVFKSRNGLNLYVLHDDGNDVVWQKRSSVSIKTCSTQSDMRSHNQIVTFRENGNEVLYAMLNHNHWRLMYKYNVGSDEWVSCVPSFWHGREYMPTAQSCYSTVQNHVVKIGNENKLITSVRLTSGMAIFSYEPEEDRWQKLPNTGQPKWDNKSGYANSEKDYGTIRSTIITLNNRDYLVSAIRRREPSQLFLYDFQEQKWHQLQKGPEWTDAAGYQKRSVYKSIMLATLQIVPGHQELIYSIRHTSGMKNVRLKIWEGNHQVFEKIKSNIIDDVFSQLRRLCEGERTHIRKKIPMPISNLTLFLSLMYAKFNDGKKAKFFENKPKSDVLVVKSVHTKGF